jgi:hypothetical protein
MGLKEEAKELIKDVIGDISAQRVDLIDDSNVPLFLNTIEQMMGNVIGEELAKVRMRDLRAKYS